MINVNGVDNHSCYLSGDERMNHENFSDEWIEKTFVKLIEEACYDFPSGEYPSEPSWYSGKINVNDARHILSTLILYPNRTVREAVFNYLEARDA